MNNPLVDEIQALSDCRTHAERAEWLLSVPLSVLSHYEMTIRNRLQIAGFHEGVEYLEKELARWRRPRWDGEPDERNGSLRQTMMLWKDGYLSMPELDAPPAPDHSTTDL